jgi:glycosyltransferase 2 family protein
VKRALQVAISAGLILVVFLHLDLSQVAGLVVRPERSPLLAAAFIAFNASKILAALRLNVYQRHAAVRLGEGDNLRLYYAGMFPNIFLPGGIGGDAYKVLVLHRSHSIPLRALVAVTLADRLGGMLTLLFILCMLAPMLPLPWDASSVVLLTPLSVAATIALFVLVHRWLIRLDGQRLAGVFALGVAVQGLQLACMAMLLAYLGTPEGSYVAYLAIFLVSSVAAVLPFSVGGLGVREATFLLGVRMFGLDPAYGVLASTCFFLITVLSSMIGSLFLGRFSLRPAATK